MIKLYLISLGADINRGELTKYFDENPTAINFWFYNLPASIFVKSTLSALELQTFIQKKVGNAPPMIIVELSSNTNYAGWIDKAHHKYFEGFMPK